MIMSKEGWKEGFSEEKLNKAIKVMDIDGDDQVNYEEFVTMMTSE